MRRALIVFTVLMQACSVGAGPELSDAETMRMDMTWPQHEPENGESGSPSSDRNNEACIAALATAEKAENGSTLSAFRIFNEYPPSQAKKAPGSVDTTSVTPDQGLISCAEDAPFIFSILVDGVLTEGKPSQLSPLTAWKVPGGHLAFYLHKNYEMNDGEGDSVEISAIVFDGSGTPTGSIQGLSSWYEYEGSIRIRDFRYLNGNFITSEQVFDPIERDESGNVLEYTNEPADSLVKRHSFDF